MDAPPVKVADVNLESMAAFTAIVVLWALVRPSAVRDGENRPLPFSFTPRLFVVLVYALAYLLLVATVYSFPDIVAKIMGTTFYFDNFKYIQDKAPFLAIFALGTLMTLAPVREVERAFLVWTHSAQNLHGDVELLAAHLRHCTFAPSKDERQRSVDELKAFNFFVTDAGTQSVELASVNYWRKATSLLRLLNDWNKDRNDVLNKAELKLLEEINTSHQRKTQLALNIVRMLNHLGRGEGAARTMQEISDLIAGAPHGDRGRMAELETRLKGLIFSEDSTDGDRPVRMSTRQLQGYLAQIQDYFVVEYQMLVEQVALLAAKTILLSGSKAAERLDILKSLGFRGIGRVQPVRLDRVLIMFLGILCAGFLIFFAVRYPEFLRQIDVPVISEDNRRLLQQYQLFNFMALALIMAFAALFGAIIGSSKAHARARYSPWHVYLGAGLLAVVVFFVVHGARLTYFGESVSQVRELRQEARKARERAAGQPPLTTAAVPAPSQDSTAATGRPQFSKADVLYRIAPQAVMPFLATIMLCWLARQQRWRTPWATQPDSQSSALWERFWDGVAVSAAVFVAYLASRGLRELMLIPTRNRDLINWQFLGPQLGLGFLIGATVVREARLAAQAQVVEIERRTAEQAGGSAPVLAPAAAS